MTALTPERLAELRRLSDAATPGPWTHIYGGYPSDKVYDATGEPLAHDCDPRDVPFIAAAREAVPDLLAENDALRSLLRDVEWRYWPVPHSDAYPSCPSCDGIRPLAWDVFCQRMADEGDSRFHKGHADDCRLAAALRGMP